MGWYLLSSPPHAQEDKWMKVKECKKCGQLVPVERFNRRSDSKDGLQSYCRTCQHGYSIEHEEVLTANMKVIDSHFTVKYLPNGVKYYQWKGC